MLETRNLCRARGAGTFEVTVTGVDRITFSLDGDVVGRDDSDEAPDVTCESSGAVVALSATLSSEQTTEIFWEIERHALET